MAIRKISLTEIWNGTRSHDVFNGGEDSDAAYGHAGNDTLFGNGGDDTLDGGIDRDTLFGGNGNDVIWGDDPPGKLALHGNDLIYGGYGNDLIYGMGGNDTIDGGWGTNTIFGNEGDDRILMGAGVETVFGGDGNDVLGSQVLSGAMADGYRFDGGAGIDTLLYHRGQEDMPDGNPIPSVIVDLKTGTIQHDGRTGSISSIEVLETFGSNFVVYGSDADETISNSSVTTDPARGSQLYGQNGADTLISGGGADLLDGGNGDDVLFGGSNADDLKGGDGDDRLYGGSGDDVIDGGGGNDTAYGGAGEDWFAVLGNLEEYDIQDLGGGTFVVTNLASGEVDHYYEFEHYMPAMFP